MSLSALLEEGSGGVKYVVLRFLPVISIAALRSCNREPYCSIMDRPWYGTRRHEEREQH